ncbi:MAG: hypothetical protein HPY87_08805 [Fervidobacterium sp.]|uniref:hypothetical protein n=1 Tax=Fervidobacterium sp. TaxID=1871331 RepID=UPI0025BD5749|nr:hypothetical protein [Fervidobacterium sp.]NPU89961.1 hypothetical protein [Fervidobacterium sp.]
MKTGTKLFVIFLISGIVVTLSLSWIIEFYKYQKRLVPLDKVERLFDNAVRTIKETYPSEDREEIARKVLDEYYKLKPNRKKMLPIDVFKVIQPALSVVNDQNFRLYPPTEPVYSVLPFTVTVVDGRVIVSSSAVKDIIAGDEVLEINGRKISELIDLLLPYTSGENYSVREQQLSSLIQLIPELVDKKKDRIGIFYRQKEYNIKVMSDGAEKTVVVKTMTAMSYTRESVQFPALPTRRPFEFYEEGNIGVFKFGTFSLSGTIYNTYREFLTNTLVYNKDMKVVLVDLRGVASRDFTIFKELFEHFVDERTSVERWISIVNTAYNISVLNKYGVDFEKTTNELLRIKFFHTFEPREPVIKADVWILFDRYTSNAALDFIYTFKKLRKDRTIGEPTLMKINHTTEVDYKFDDSAKTSFMFPTAVISEDTQRDVVLEPDYEIELSTEERINYVKGIEDVMLNKALEIIKERTIKR